MALELKQSLALDEMRLLPAGVPPPRHQPLANPDQRSAMLTLALADCSDLHCDPRELHDPGPAYSIRTLEQLRGEVGKETSLCLAMGMDSLASLNTWHRW